MSSNLQLKYEQMKSIVPGDMEWKKLGARK